MRPSVSGLLESLHVCPVLHRTNVAQQRHAGCRVAVIRRHLGSAAVIVLPVRAGSRSVQGLYPMDQHFGPILGAHSTQFSESSDDVMHMHGRRCIPTQIFY